MKKIIIFFLFFFLSLPGFTQEAGQGLINPREAMFYEKFGEKNQVHCLLCPRNCVISPGQYGFCRARKNIDGKLYSLSYANPCAVHIDPIEKKPFSHYLPQTFSFSIASAGCNMRCLFCQNWNISQVKPEETYNYSLPPQLVVKMAKETECASIAYTYSEPTNFYEYMLDTAKIAKKEGIKNVYHSNGYINEEPLRELCKYLDAANIDLKGFSNEYYEKFCEANLEPVLETLKILKEEGVWLEITNLILPGQNDDPKMIKEMCLWIKKNLGTDVPLHFSRFYPMYKLQNLPPTPTKTLEEARDIALKCGLNYVYIGNVGGHPGEDTYCPKCKKKIIDRNGYKIIENNIVNGKCKYCGEKIAGIW